LVALAITGGTPANSRAGKAINEPPPAKEFIAPAINPAPNKNKTSSILLLNGVGDICMRQNLALV